ncbi:MAG: hypothetical protein KDD76_05470, partial [Rickettsiales bacterium]|nr:hypothetical protein [Rickettsiales bacterium]
MLSSRQLLQFVAPATVALFATAALAYTPTLPAPLKKTFDAAYQTGDQFIISSVKDCAKQE